MYAIGSQESGYLGGSIAERSLGWGTGVRGATKLHFLLGAVLWLYLSLQIQALLLCAFFCTYVHYTYRIRIRILHIYVCAENFNNKF